MSGHSKRQGGLRWRRVAPIAGAALLAFGAGAILGGRHVASSQRIAEQFAEAWQRGDVGRMYELTDAPGSERSLRSFARAYRDAEITATATSVRFGPARGAGDNVYAMPATVTTRAFGTVHTDLRIPVTEIDGEPRVTWSSALVFPGLREGERLHRRTGLPPRAPLLARDRTPMARGDTPASPAAASIVGQIGRIPADRAQALRAQGVPDDAQVGISGLERILDDELRGRAGGVLMAGDRTLGSHPPRAAKPVRSTISLKVQQSAIDALAGRLGGIVALKPRSGEVLAAAGIPISGLQPPGSTFKIITLTAGLEAGITEPSKTYPVQTEALLEGVPLENANGESCGGTLVQSFAHSCNSVFAPMGAQLGAERLVDAARRFGFDEDPGVPGAATPTIPPAGEIGDDLAVGSSAIGQGRVQATALAMAVVAATIANDGRRPRPTFLYGERRGTVRATSRKVAHQVQRMMQDVVAYGTGVAAAISGVKVAGKTGTAELEDTRKTPGEEVTPTPGTEPAAPEPPNTDAWFVAYAPSGKAKKPRVAVGVLVVRAGAGGDVAAPAARQVLSAAL